MVKRILLVIGRKYHESKKWTWRKCKLYKRTNFERNGLRKLGRNNPRMQIL
jgi:hypothetical protein